MKNITISDIDTALKKAIETLSTIYTEELITNQLKEHSDENGKISAISAAMAMYRLGLDQSAILIKETLKGLLVD